MKWCSNCRAYRESWADRIGCGHSDSRCWNCDNYSLASGSLVLPSASYLIDRNEVQGLVNEVRRGWRNGFECRKEGFDRDTGEYRCEILQYDKSGEWRFSIERRRGC